MDRTLLYDRIGMGGFLPPIPLVHYPLIEHETVTDFGWRDRLITDQSTLCPLDDFRQRTLHLRRTNDTDNPPDFDIGNGIIHNPCPVHTILVIVYNDHVIHSMQVPTIGTKAIPYPIGQGTVDLCGDVGTFVVPFDILIGPARRLPHVILKPDPILPNLALRGILDLDIVEIVESVGHV